MVFKYPQSPAFISKQLVYVYVIIYLEFFFLFILIKIMKHALFLDVWMIIQRHPVSAATLTPPGARSDPLCCER